jgi:hypothetical protein
MKCTWALPNNYLGGSKYAVHVKITDLDGPMWKRILYIKHRVEPKYDTIRESNYPVPLNMAPVQGLQPSLWYNKKKIINNEAYVVSDHRLPTLKWQLKA